MKLEFNNITKHYKDKLILDNASFCLNENEIVSIMGPSGIGKSTIARIICRTVNSESGNILLDGKDIWDRKLIQLIPQQPYASLNPKQSVIETVMEPLLFHKIAVDKKEAFVKAKELLNEMLIDDELFARRPGELSGGQAQRVLIARSLTVEPVLLIADEATSMLDQDSQTEIISIFIKLVRDKKLSLLFISHDIDLVDSISNRKYELKAGKLLEVAC